MDISIFFLLKIYIINSKERRLKKKQFIRGSKRKCASCGTLFFDLERFPIICPNCGASVALQTNVSKRGRPPKIQKIGQKIGKNIPKNWKFFRKLLPY